MTGEALCAMGALRGALTPGPRVKWMEQESLSPTQGLKGGRAIEAPCRAVQGLLAQPPSARCQEEV